MGRGAAVNSVLKGFELQYGGLGFPGFVGRNWDVEFVSCAA